MEGCDTVQCNFEAIGDVVVGENELEQKEEEVHTLYLFLCLCLYSVLCLFLVLPTVWDDDYTDCRLADTLINTGIADNTVAVAANIHIISIVVHTLTDSMLYSFLINQKFLILYVISILSCRLSYVFRHLPLEPELAQ